MEQLETLKDLILPVLDSLDIQLYDLKWVNDKKARILQIAVMRADGSMDIDTCALVSEKISEVLDAHDDLIRSEYFLEVCSPGAERELRSPQELQYTFREFAPYLDQCRFQGCAHVKEKGCAVLEAVKAGEIAPSRHESYVRLYQQAKEVPEWKRRQMRGE